MEEMLIDGISSHRQQWCVRCGTTRVYFEMGWAYQIPDLARAHPCCDEKGKHTFLSTPPERSYPTQASKKVLGRGLKELMAQSTPQSVKGLLEEQKK